METTFTPAPHQEAAALLHGKPVVAREVFDQLLPELRARVFTISGIEAANVLQAARDAIASVPLGDQTWDEAKKEIVEQLDPYLGDGAEARAELVLRVNSFQAYSASLYETAMKDEDTTHLQYLHGECKVPTPSHLALNGIVLPKDDPFWDTHIGPWGHLGCVCYVRPMNPDLVDDERAKDQDRPPEEKNVLEGAARKKINEGTILRPTEPGGVAQQHNLSPDGPDNSGFTWSPGDFRIPLKDLEAKYDPEVWSEFQKLAQSQKLGDQRTVWDWLNGAEISTPSFVVDASAPPKEMRAFRDRMIKSGFSKEIADQALELPATTAAQVATVKINTDNTQTGHYTPATKTISMHSNPDNWSGRPGLLFHEFAHHVHSELGEVTHFGVSDRFSSAMKSDLKRLREMNKAEPGRFEPYACTSFAQKLYEIADYATASLAEKSSVARFCDTLGALTKGNWGWGHTKTYYRQYFGGAKEAFANAFHAIVEKDAIFAQWFPETVRAVQAAIAPSPK